MLVEITLKPTFTTLTTLTTLDPNSHFTRFSPIPTSTLSLLNLLCQDLFVLVDHLGYFDRLIGAPDTRHPRLCSVPQVSCRLQCMPWSNQINKGGA